MFRKIMKNKSIFSYLLVVMCILVLIETTILVGSLSTGGMFAKLNQNAKDIVDQRVINRSSYLQNEMLNNWSNLSQLTDHINTTAKQLVSEGKVDYEHLDDSSETATPLILAVVDQLISTMRSQHVTGAYIIFNNHDLDKGLEDKPGIYLRDLDPLSKASAENGDLLIERAPTEVVKSLNIATDSSWRPRFEFKKANIKYYDFFYTPYQQAISNSQEFSSTDMGYWGGSFRLRDSENEAFTYSLPLINDQGAVYGVVGIDITLDYLNKLLPSTELLDEGNGSYLLAINQDDSLILSNILTNGNIYTTKSPTTELMQSENDYYINQGSNTLYSSLKYLNIYNSNTPYSNQRCALVGIVDTSDLFAFTNKITSILMFAIFLTLTVGIGGSFIFSYIISKPIKKLSDEVVKANIKNKISFRRTNIAEIDHLANMMEQLNQNVRDTALKFTNLLQMASIKLAGFEYNINTEELFISENFFEVLLKYDVNTSELTMTKFKETFEGYKQYIVSHDYSKKEYLFKIPDDDNYVFVNLRLLVNDNAYTGVIENVTNTIVEKNVIEYERDHDALTGLLNRRAFIRIMNSLFENEINKIKIAALLMLDLDNLKYINDNYGHEIGDNYISKAAETFVNSTPENTIISRISGDEFFVFFYGYDDENVIKQLINKLKEAISKAFIPLADNSNFHVNASGGIAWYPRDSESFEKLQHYADYAMYKIKRTSKGNLTEFNLNDYIADSFLSESKEELNTIIEDRAIQFYFQPIISSKDGTIYAYESLMRSFMPSLKNPLDILKIAKEEGRLAEIEELTWSSSLETFANHLRNERINKDCKIFINSISNQILSNKKIDELEKEYSKYLKNVVLEVTEVEYIDENYHQQKAELMKKWQAELALDDYGSGYNSDRILLLISPKFIKIDMDIIRNIDSDPDKCKIVENIVNYAHERDMKLIAEGIETIDELKQVIKLKVDYLQGFLLAKPQYLPPRIQEDVIKLIQLLNEK